jgi:hypothetical protein
VNTPARAHVNRMSVSWRSSNSRIGASQRFAIGARDVWRRATGYADSELNPSRTGYLLYVNKLLLPSPEIAEIKAALRHAKTRREADRIKAIAVRRRKAALQAGLPLGRLM